MFLMELIHDLKTPPHSLEAEQAVLGGLMIDNETYWEVSGIVRKDDFYRKEHRLIYEAISQLTESDQPSDVVTLSELLKQQDELEKAGGMIYLGMLAKDTPSAANIKAYAQIVAERSRARQAISVMNDGVSALFGKEDPDDIVSQTQAKLEAINSGLRKEVSFMDILRKGIDMIDENRIRRVEGKQAGVSYSLKALDERTGGLRKSQLITIAGRPSLGKTALSHQIALNAARAGIPIGEISLEMSEEQLAIRSFANRFRVNGTALMFGHDGPIQRVTDGLSADPGFRNIPLYIDSQTFEYHAIVSRIVEWKRKHDIQAVFIDHLGLIQLDAFDKKVDRLGYMTNNLKRLVKRLDMPIVILCQLNRSSEKEKRRPALSDLRDCGEIEQDVDVAIFLHSEGDDEAEDVEIEIGLLKNRDGIRGWLPKTIQFLFRKQIQTFEQL